MFSSAVDLRSWRDFFTSRKKSLLNFKLSSGNLGAGATKSGYLVWALLCMYVLMHEVQGKKTDAKVSSLSQTDGHFVPEHMEPAHLVPAHMEPDTFGTGTNSVSGDEHLHALQLAADAKHGEADAATKEAQALAESARHKAEELEAQAKSGKAIADKKAAELVSESEKLKRSQLKKTICRPELQATEEKFFIFINNPQNLWYFYQKKQIDSFRSDAERDSAQADRDVAEATKRTAEQNEMDAKKAEVGEKLKIMSAMI